MVPTRELYWNIHGWVLLYLLMVISLTIFAYGFYRRYRLWRLGRPEVRWDQLKERLWSLLAYGFGHRRILRDPYPGLMHFLVFWGFVVLFIGTLLVAVQADLHLPILYGTFYLYFSLFLDIFGILATLGIIIAAFRRYGQRPDRLDSGLDDALTLLWLFLILASGFAVEGLRIAATHDPWASWSPFGLFFARLFAGLSRAGLVVTHRWLWWIHLVLAMGLIAYLPYSKLLHILVSPANQFFRRLTPVGAISLVDLENSETFGVSQLKEFSWKHLLDLDACTRCGRCQDNCPAYLSQKPLSPKAVIQDLRKELNRLSPEPRTLAGEVIAAEAIWACTTCRSCEEQCPVFVEPLAKLIEFRRYAVLMEGSGPAELNRVFKNVENSGNPYGLSQASRGDWAAELGVKTMAEADEVDYLFWVGCAGSYDQRSLNITKSLARILQRAGVNFAILGSEEKCCGDWARRSGNEYLFQSLALENIEVMKGYNVKRIVTACPHGYNTLKNEYPQLGGNFEVVHHTELLAKLLREGRIKLDPVTQEALGLTPVEISGEAGASPTTPGGSSAPGTVTPPGLKVTYHDSCYLGRYNQIYAEPRLILKGLAVTGELLEMERNRGRSFCCGAGGGRMWLEETEGQRINLLRTEQALATGANVIGTACPFCLTMFEDGLKLKGKGEEVKVYDIAELVEKAMAEKRTTTESPDLA